MGKAIDTYHQIYDKFLLTGDFNAEDAEPCLSQFLFEYVINLVNEKTCFKSKTNPSCIDLSITSSSNSFLSCLSYNGCYISENYFSKK